MALQREQASPKASSPARQFWRNGFTYLVLGIALVVVALLTSVLVLVAASFWAPPPAGQTSPLMAAVGGLGVLGAAIITASATITLAQDRAKTDKQIVDLKGRLDANAAEVRFEVEKQLAALGESSQTRLKIADARLPAYQAFWKCMSPVSPSKAATLTPGGRQRLDDKLREVFFDEGAGIVLSHEVLTLYRKAVGKLHDEQVSDENVRDAFSELRRQMKLDLSIYTGEQANTPTG